MLLMTCSLGGTIRIGDEIQMTLQGRDQERVAVSVIAPAGADLYFDGVCVRPLVLPSGTQSYFFSLKAVRRFRVDDVEVGVWLPGDALPSAATYRDCVHVGIAAPQSFRIGYEHDARAFGSSEWSRLHASRFWN